MDVLGEKMGDGHADRSATVLRIVSGVVILRSSRVRPTLLMASERLPCTWTSMRSVRVVCIRFSPVGCTSIQITMTLIYE
jgi:hypothetical protein